MMRGEYVFDLFLPSCLKADKISVLTLEVYCFVISQLTPKLAIDGSKFGWFSRDRQDFHPSMAVPALQKLIF